MLVPEINIINWADGGLRVYAKGEEHTPENMPDDVVDTLVTLLERWEARNG